MEFGIKKGGILQFLDITPVKSIKKRGIGIKKGGILQFFEYYSCQKY